MSTTAPKNGHGGPRANAGGARAGAGRPAGRMGVCKLVHNITGGARKNAGRPRGSLNHDKLANAKTLASLARIYTGDVLRQLVRIVQHGDSDSARVSAAKLLLERGYGAPSLDIHLSGADGGPIIHRVERVIVDVAQQKLIEGEAEEVG